MYRIMLVVKEGKNYDSLYKYLTVTNTKGEVVPYEATTIEELDAQVESMLNSDYRKKDFIIVTVTDYDVVADLAENETETPDDSTDGGDDDVTP